MKIQRVYSKFQNLKNNNSALLKRTSRYAMFIFAAFVVFNIFNAQAQEQNEFADTKISSGYQGDVAIINTHTGDNEANIGNLEVKSLEGKLEGLVILAAPQLSENAAEIQSNASIPQFQKQGLVGALDSNIVAMMNNQPAVNVNQHLAQEWVPGYDEKLVSTYAADSGYTILTKAGVDSIWQKTRMIAYVIFVLVLMTAGFMIMFRKKIGGQVAVTIFNTIPNVIVGLVLVTFSFAIVGVVINIGTLLTGVVKTFFTGQTLVSINHPLSLMGLIVNPGGGFGGLTAGAITAVIPSILGGLVAAVFATGGGAAAAAAVGGIIFAIIALAVIGIFAYASVRVYITLMKAYVGLLIDTIMAPIFIAIGSFPGQENVRGDWFKRIIRGTLTFSLVYFFVNLGVFILESGIDLTFPSGLVGNQGAGGATINAGIAIFTKGFIFIYLMFVAADAPKMLDDFLPMAGGKGLAGAFEGAKAGIKKVPILGSFF